MRWARSTLKDGKITIAEGLALVVDLAVLFDLPTEINLPNIKKFIYTDKKFNDHIRRRAYK